jgi:regulator of RNase E activity RraA
MEIRMIINDSVRDSAKTLSNEILAKYRSVDPATIGHIFHFGFSSVEFRASVPGARAIGRAVTLRVPSMDSTLCHKVPEYLGPGDILVIDRAGEMNYACLGGGVAYALKLTGVEAVILDGAATDIQEIRDCGLILFYRRLSAITTRILGYDGEINTIVSCGGTVIRPGDIMVADENGFVALPPENAEEILQAALDRQNKQPERQALLRNGARLADISKAGEYIRAKLGK